MADTTHNSEASHVSPVARFWAQIARDRGDVVVLCAYTVVAGLLSLALPIAVQALVNSVAASMTQPLFVLSLVAFSGLLLAGILWLMQFALIETMQQRLFVRSALGMAEKIIRSKSSALSGVYGPELANRFFDVLTVQKTMAKILLDGLAASFQVIVGLALLAVYDHSGLLLGFDLLLLAFLAFVFFPLGVGGLSTSLDESVYKYRIAAWLEELARCTTTFKLQGEPNFLMKRMDVLAVGWLKERRRHFRVTMRQETGNQLFQAVASAGVLAIGGYLVVRRELTLGQLVAAQLIVAQALKGIDKIVRLAETWYDLLTGLDKTSYITDLETERTDGLPVPPSAAEGASAIWQDVRFRYAEGAEVLVGLSLSIAPGDRVSLVGKSGAGKSTLASLVSGLENPSHGRIAVNGQDIRDTDLSSLRRVVSVAGVSDDLFDGTIGENIALGRPEATPERIAHAIEIACLSDDIALMPSGLQTRILSSGRNLSLGQAQRLRIARAIADSPRLLILDEAFTGIDESTALEILDRLFAPENGWTIVDISHDGSVVSRTRTVHVLADGRIVETGTPEGLAASPDSKFVRLFPQLCQRLRRTETF